MKNIDLVRFETIKILNKKCNIYNIFIIILLQILDNKLLLTIMDRKKKKNVVDVIYKKMFEWPFRWVSLLFVVVVVKVRL